MKHYRDPHGFAIESVKICHFKTFRAESFALGTFCCFFLHYIDVKDIRPKWKHNGIQNIANAPTLTHRYILIYIFALLMFTCFHKMIRK